MQNKPLKGRKKFNADVQQLATLCVDGWEVAGLRVHDFKHGDDEGSVLCEIVRASSGEPVVALNIIVPDTSEYPHEHSYICCTTNEGEVPPHVLRVISSVHDYPSRVLEDLLKSLLTSFSNIHVDHTPRSDDYEENGDDMDGDGDSDADAYHSDDDYYGLPSAQSEPNVDKAFLRRDFVGVVEHGYRPGLIRLNQDQIALSVSKPAFRLADTISSQALMAWDPRLLSSTRHLTLIITGLRGAYPVLTEDGKIKPSATGITSKLAFKVGLTERYKPDTELVADLTRSYGLKEEKQEPLVLPEQSFYELDDDYNEDADWTYADNMLGEPPVEEEETEAESFSFALSSSLEALMNSRFLDLLQIRLKYHFGWAAAESLLTEVHQSQRKEDDVFQECIEALQLADLEEAELATSNNLPADPLAAYREGAYLNLPLIAYSYLLRRLTLCSRFCLVCYNKLKTDFQALKPYVCDNKLCTYQYYSLNLGPSLEYEICTKPQTVDLLASLTYSAASAGSLTDFPVGMNLQVPVQGHSTQLCDFDGVPDDYKRRVITDLLNALPSVADMKKFLEKKRGTGSRKVLLKDIDRNVLPAAWQILRWCVASCTAHLEELTEREDLLIGVGAEFKQFRFTVGAPDAEAKFYAAQKEARQQNANAKRYPSLYAFHGSPTKNWHSIIRHGLWFKEIAHGRAYGDGVYFAKDGAVSISGYAHSSGSVWTKSAIQPYSCIALAEIVNLPQQFRSSTPYFVVPQTQWIVCRYLLVKGAVADYTPQRPMGLRNTATTDPNIPVIKMDPANVLTISSTPIAIPQAAYKLNRLLAMRQAEFMEEDNDEEDSKVLSEEADDSSHSDSNPNQTRTPVVDDWKHDAAWVETCVQHMLPAPVDASPMATTALQRELTQMLKEQQTAGSLKELGWYMPEEFIGDNLFQWIVELHSFDPELPIAKDLKERGVNSLVFEIRFPPTFPHSPPFFRILKPRFLPFIQGGGGHVTGGGSMCMDLLTSDGWLPSYSISAILLQIKLAISNLDPRPARLAKNWSEPYQMREAVEGYKRAASAHGWKIPANLDRLTY